MFRGPLGNGRRCGTAPDSPDFRQLGPAAAIRHSGQGGLCGCVCRGDIIGLTGLRGRRSAGVGQGQRRFAPRGRRTSGRLRRPGCASGASCGHDTRLGRNSPCLAGGAPLGRPAEMWPSGRRHTPAKGAGGKPSRGFESLRLRHILESISYEDVRDRSCSDVVRRLFPKVYRKEPDRGWLRLDSPIWRWLRLVRGGRMAVCDRRG